MEKNLKLHYLTVLSGSTKIDGELANDLNLKSNNIGLYGLIGIIPKYSKPFSKEYLQKIQNDYKNWIDSCQEQQYHEMMKEAELKDSKLKSNSNPPIQNQSLSTKFDHCKARRILSKSLKTKNVTFNGDSNFKNNTSIVENSITLDYKISNLHGNKQFHVGSVERRDDGTFKTFDPTVTNKREAEEKKLSKKILRYDELDLQQKKEKARLLHSEMADFLNTKRNERLQLGLACHQEWALMKVSAPSLNNRIEVERPITTSSKEAMEELEQFEQKQKLIRKEKKAALLKSNEFSPNTTNNNYVNEFEHRPEQSFKLTQLPPGSAIVGEES